MFLENWNVVTLLKYTEMLDRFVLLHTTRPVITISNLVDEIIPVNRIFSCELECYKLQ